MTETIRGRSKDNRRHGIGSKMKQITAGRMTQTTGSGMKETTEVKIAKTTGGQ